jgi:pyruvate dehydrogenase E2 component (dihydrolipoamide acetyltransferase)
VTTEIRMPQWGMAMKEGAVLKWLKAIGDPIEVDEPLLEVESAKAVGEVPSPVSGVVTEIRVPAGEVARVQAVLAVIGAAGEAPVGGGDGASPSPGAAPGGGTGERKVVPAARKRAKELGVDVDTVTGSGPDGRVTAEDVERAAAAPAASGSAASAAPAATAATDAPGGAPQATPVARKLAATLGVDLAAVVGTGPGGRITKEDVERLSARDAQPAAVTPPPAPASAPAAAAVPPTRLPMRGIRRVVAERMTASLRESAQLTLGRHVWMDEAMALRARLVASWEPEGIRPSYTDLVVAAVARALRVHPVLNSALEGSVEDGEIVVSPSVDIGLAVATDDGLLVPVVREADQLGLRGLAGRTAEIAAAARARTLGMDELSGSTFTVSALGATGVEWFTPILNSPEVGILGVGAITPTWRSGPEGPVAAYQMTLSLTVDHRIVDGAPAGQFLATVAELLEDPYRLLG